MAFSNSNENLSLDLSVSQGIFKSLIHEDIKAAISYAAELSRERLVSTA
ncbi:MAG: hypothetical protein HY753_08640 [Nitrospirae bacterium]|nr:hypothetical protein [Nitrospirota bacterium]